MTSRLLIQGAVKCPQWQELRKWLKTLPLNSRLYWLNEYVRPIDWEQRRAADEATKLVVRLKTNKEEETVTERQVTRVTCDCDYITRCIQALNYVNALSRGGLIEPLHPMWNDHTNIDKFLREKRYVIKGM